jgi:hypothetical protein
MQGSTFKGLVTTLCNDFERRADLLQCDETQPRCQRCASSDIQCPGYDTGLKFLDQGGGLRRKYNHDETTSRSSSGSKRTRGPLAQSTDSINEPWKALRSVDDSTDPSTNNKNDIGMPESHDTSPAQISNTVLGPRQDVDAHISSRHSQEDRQRPTQPDSYFHSPYTAINASPDTLVLQSPYGATESLSKSVDSVYYTARKPSKVLPTLPTSIQGGPEVENNFEILFLIRHFSEIVGPWQVSRKLLGHGSIDLLQDGFIRSRKLLCIIHPHNFS